MLVEKVIQKPTNKNVIDTITLNYNDRFIRRKKLVSDNNLEFLVNLPETISVNKDDGFLLDDGNVILIKNAKESETKASEIILSVEDLNHEIVFTLVDRGKGMTESQLQQALLPFFTTKKEGTGVGLALCNEIVIAHGGKLRLSNRVDGGLSVVFSLKN